MIGRTQAWSAEHGDGWTEPVAVKVEVKVEGTETVPLPAAVKQEPGESGGGGGDGGGGGTEPAVVKVELEGTEAVPLPAAVKQEPDGGDDTWVRPIILPHTTRQVRRLKS